jgi:hypothetical protein
MMILLRTISRENVGSAEAEKGVKRELHDPETTNLSGCGGKVLVVPPTR